MKPWHRSPGERERRGRLRGGASRSVPALALLMLGAVPALAGGNVIRGNMVGSNASNANPLTKGFENASRAAMPAYARPVPPPVTLSGTWTTGLTHSAGAGSDRLLVFVTCMENVGDRDITNVTYGAQAMTPAVERAIDAGSSRFSRCEIWYLDEAGIQGASGNTFQVTYSGGSPSGSSHAAATFTGVEQSTPILATASAATLSGATISTAPFSVAREGLAVTGVIHGSAGSYNNSAWGAGWTEESDQSPGGWTMGTANTTNPYGADGTDIATATHTVSTNRQVMVVVSLASAYPSFLSSAADQTFWVGKAPTSVSPITVGDASTATVTAANDIRIRIPAGFDMSWDTLDVAATIGGPAAAKVSSTVSYEDGGATLVLDVTSNFAPGDTITIAGLSFLDFTAASGTDNLELEVDNAGTVAAEDDKAIQILAAGTPTISSELDQSFRVGDPPVSNSTITVRADAAAPTITAANDIRIRIPFGLNMQWDVSDVTALILGAGAAKVSSTVSYEDGGKTLVIDVLTDFDPGDLITIADLSFANFTAASLDDNLELEVGNDGQVSAYDDKVIFIVLILVTPDIHSSRDQFFTVGDPSTSIVAIRVTDDDDIAQITAANDIRIRIPAGLDMVWDVTDVTAQIGARASTKVSPNVTYEDGGKTLVLDVITDFVARDWISVRGLSVTTFSSAGAAGRLELEVFNDGSTSSIDGYIKQILGSVISVDVWPDTVSASRLPSNGSNYSVDFTVSNLGNTTDNYDLLTSAAPGTAITVVSITGAGVSQGADPDSAYLASLPAGEWATVTVTYSVGVVPVATIDTLSFLARSVASPTQSDDGQLILTVIRPNITISKVVNPSGTQAPGTDLTYTGTLTNAGTEEAVGVSSVSSIAPETEFKLGSVVTTFAAGIGVVVEYSDDHGAGWTYTPVSLGCGAPAGYDGCLTDIRWTLQNPLSASAPDNAGTMEYVARIE